MVTYPDAPMSVLERWEGRRGRLSFHEGEALADPDVDLAALAVMPPPPPPASRSGHGRKLIALTEEFQEGTALHVLNGLVISHLRKRVFPKHAPQLFHRIWAEEGPRLQQELPTRWLISSMITFGDHGATEGERRLGLSLGMLLSTMKLYEYERLFSGTPPDRAFRIGKKVREALPLDMPAFSLRWGGLDYNLLAPIWAMAEREGTAGPLARELLSRLNDDTRGIFARLQSMRAAMPPHPPAAT